MVLPCSPLSHFPAPGNGLAQKRTEAAMPNNLNHPMEGSYGRLYLEILKIPAMSEGLAVKDYSWNVGCRCNPKIYLPKIVKGWGGLGKIQAI